MAKRVVCLLACGTLPTALSFSLSMSTPGATSQLRHPNFPDRMVEYRNLEAGVNGGLRTTKAGGALINDLSETHSFTPLERVFLTLSGNVQTAFSSFYLQEVELSANMKPAPITPADVGGGKIPLAVLDRNVNVKVGGHDCFKVTSKVKVYDPALYAAYTSQTVGLDQLLKMFNIRPKFTLQDAGRTDDGGVWRFYTLECHKGMVDFEIVEEFDKDAWHLPLVYTRRVKSQVPHPNYPERMLTKANDEVNVIRNELTTMNSGGNLIHYLSDAHDLSPRERVAVTANGSLQMVFSSFYLGEVEVKVTRNEEIDVPEEEKNSPTPPVACFDREVLQSISGCLWCKATSIVRVYDEEVLEAYKSMGIGNLLRELDLNPVNTLHDAGRSDDGGMWRFYTMACKGTIEFDILEEFPENVWDLPCMPELKIEHLAKKSRVGA